MAKITKNSNLSNAKKAKNDEFYTQYHDIEKEMNAYLDFDENVFRDKTVLLPCDDPEWSNFTLYFAQNFSRLGLKKLISTSFAHKSKQLNTPYQPSFLESESPQFDDEKSNQYGKIFTLTHDLNNDGRIDSKDLQWDYLKGDGDFRSDEIKALRDEADIIVTNPPFSLFREFVNWIDESGKKFVIIGSMNAITYKEIFPLIKDNKMWLGNGFTAGNAFFATPIQREYADGVYDNETGLVKFRNCCWFTNLEHGRRHQELKLMTMNDNLKFNKKLDGKNAYQEYDNYNAIEVPFTNAIPSDFDGVMGVPISFLDKYNPEQFEIVASDFQLKDGDFQELKKSNWNGKFDRGYLDNQRMYSRLLIRHKKGVN